MGRRFFSPEVAVCITPTGAATLSSSNQIHRVQSASYASSLELVRPGGLGNYGQGVPLREGAVGASAQLQYLSTNPAYSVARMGLTTGDGTLLFSGILAGNYEPRNIYLLYAQDGVDLTDGGSPDSTVAIGECYPTNYSFEVSVGQLASESVAFQGLNLLLTGTLASTPDVNHKTSALVGSAFTVGTLAQFNSSEQPVLSPTKVQANTASSEMVPFVSGTGQATVPIQSVAVSTDITWTPQFAIGWRLPKRLVPDPNIRTTFTVTVDPEAFKQFSDTALYSTLVTRNLSIVFPQGSAYFRLDVKGAYLTNYEMPSLSVGDAVMKASATYEVVHGAPNSSTKGLFMYTEVP